MTWLLVLLFFAFLGAFELLAWFWIPQPRTERPADEVPVGELQKRFGLWEKLAGIPFFLFLVPCMAGWFFLFWWIRDAFHKLIPPSEMLLVPSVAMFLVPAFFLGFCSVMYPLAWLYRLLLGSDYAEYTRFTTERTEVSPAVVFRRISQLVVPIAIGFSLLACDWYTRLTPQEFVENSIFSLGEAKYAMADIVELRDIAGFIAPNGNHVQRPYFEIQFTDGFRWNSSQDLYSLNDRSYLRLIQRLSDLTGKPVVKYPLPP